MGYFDWPNVYGEYDEQSVYIAKRHIVELEMLKHIQETDPNHLGHYLVPHLLDHFTHCGSHGEHVCLVSKEMGQSLDEFRKQ